MIGIIGPADSVGLALEMATIEGAVDRVIARPYDAVEEAPDLAHELDGICQVILFTGRAPYALARRTGEFRATLEVVPHGGSDLYRTLFLLLREFAGRIPRASIDTLDADTVDETYRDLGLEPIPPVLTLEPDPGAEAVRSSDDILAYHRQQFSSGAVEVCLTCIGGVHASLAAAGIPARRITHTRSSMREAVRQALLAERLALTESAQPAAVLVNVAGHQGETPGDSATYEAERRRLRTREALVDVAERLRGRVMSLDETTFVVQTSRGAVEDAVARLLAGHDAPLDTSRFPEGARIGVGLGHSVQGAEDNARRALILGGSHEGIHIVFADGDVFRVGPDARLSSFQLRATDESALRLARQLGLGPLSMGRLTRALREVDASAVTASELARAYGIEPRSARRLMTRLRRAGIATRLGSHAGPRAGRPEAVYRVDVSRLVAEEPEA